MWSWTLLVVVSVVEGNRTATREWEEESGEEERRSQGNGREGGKVERKKDR